MGSTTTAQNAWRALNQQPTEIRTNKVLLWTWINLHFTVANKVDSHTLQTLPASLERKLTIRHMPMSAVYSSSGSEYQSENWKYKPL